MNGRLSITKEWKFVELVWKAYKKSVGIYQCTHGLFMYYVTCACLENQ